VFLRKHCIIEVLDTYRYSIGIKKDLKNLERPSLRVTPKPLEPQGFRGLAYPGKFLGNPTFFPEEVKKILRLPIFYL